MWESLHCFITHRAQTAPLISANTILTIQGHTKKLHIYSIGQHFALVDMPGYGYNMPRTFYKSVETFLNSSRRYHAYFLKSCDP